MAANSEIANDLDAQAARLRKTGNDALQASLRRGAQAIRELQSTLAELEAAAEAEAQKYERYFNGDDLG